MIYNREKEAKQNSWEAEINKCLAGILSAE